MKSLLLPMIALSLWLFAGCAKSENNPPAIRQITSFELESVRKNSSEASSSQDAQKSADGGITIAVKVNGQAYKIAPKLGELTEGFQWYLGEFFYDLRARCLEATCTRIALGMRVHFAGGTIQETASFRQIFAKIDLDSGSQSEVVKRADSTNPATLDDYLAGSLK